jgi:DNA repair protein RadC
MVGGKGQMEVGVSLLGQFGSLQSLASATADEMAAVDGVSPLGACRLQAAIELGRRLAATREEDGRPMCAGPEDAAALLMPRMQHLEQEYLYVLPLSTRNRLMGEPVEVYHGSLASTVVRIAELMRPAIRLNAASVIVAHNHPSGDPTPSPEDVAITRALVEAGRLLDIEVLDHIVIGNGRFVSLRAKGLGFG